LPKRELPWRLPRRVAHLWSQTNFKRRGSREWLDVHDTTRIRTTGCTAAVGRRWEQCAVTMMARGSEKERVAACGAVLLFVVGAVTKLARSLARKV